MSEWEREGEREREREYASSSMGETQYLPKPTKSGSSPFFHRPKTELEGGGRGSREQG